MSAASLLLFAIAQTPQLTPFVAPGDGYSILMPAKPILATQNVEGIASHIYLARTAPMVCVASKSTLPKGFTAINRATMRKAMLASFVQSSHSTIVRSHPATHAGISGEETDFTNPMGKGTVWIAETPSAIYMLAAVGRTAATQARVKPYLASFRPS